MSARPSNSRSRRRRSHYHFDILRLGYYGGNGARMIASGLRPSATLPQTQPACLTTRRPGCRLRQLGAVRVVDGPQRRGLGSVHRPPRPRRHRRREPDPVRRAQRREPFRVLLQTSDATWEAYNAYGGNSLYSCTVACPPGNPQAYKAAYAVSYNRPFDGTLPQDGGQSDPFYAEYQLIRFIEANGYDVSYTSQPTSTPTARC